MALNIQNIHHCRILNDVGAQNSDCNHRERDVVVVSKRLIVFLKVLPA